ncbi:S-antigen protein-like [Ovis canadensis]|uniref:S-antigen protein-like n=1 Tax=Ovis canadensis TaxID=37174 RepID=UPI00375246DF
MSPGLRRVFHLAARVQSPGQGRDLREVAARAETEPGDRRVTAHARRRGPGRSRAARRGARGGPIGGPRCGEPDGGEEEPDKARGGELGPGAGAARTVEDQGSERAVGRSRVGAPESRGPKGSGGLGARGGEGERRVAERSTGDRDSERPGVRGPGIRTRGGRGAGIPTPRPRDARLPGPPARRLGNRPFKANATQTPAEIHPALGSWGPTNRINAKRALHTRSLHCASVSPMTL